MMMLYCLLYSTVQTSQIRSLFGCVSTRFFSSLLTSGVFFVSISSICHVCVQSFIQRCKFAMVVFVLCMKADLEGVASVGVVPGANFCISVKNPLSPEDEVRENVVIDSSEFEEREAVGNSLRGIDKEPPCHFAVKWEGAPMRSTIQVLTTDDDLKKKIKNASMIPRTITSEDNGNFVPILALECQGLEPYNFHPIGGEFAVASNSGEKFEKVDLSEGAWNEYELGSGSTALTNLEWKFV